MSIAMLFSFFFVALSVPCVFCNLLPIFPFFSKIQLPQGVISPESVSLGPNGDGLYVTVTDGRILKYLGPGQGFIDFATTSPTRTKEQCDGTVDPDLIFTCGRPLAISFNLRTRDLYIVDSVLGLFVVGPQGGLATNLATTAEGVTLGFLNGVDVDQQTENVYFSSSTTTYDIRNITQPGFVPDSSGRLLEYNPNTKQVTVLLRNLSVAIGPAVNLDGSFVVFSEYSNKRILRYWLRGPLATTHDVLLTVPGFPNKIKRTQFGDFWLPVNDFNPQTQVNSPTAYKFNALGIVLHTMDLSAQYYNVNVTVVNEQNGVLRIGSRLVDFIGVFKSILSK